MTERVRTHIEFWHTGDAGKATEPAADHGLVGRGETAPLAVANYAEAIEAGAGGERRD